MIYFGIIINYGNNIENKVSEYVLITPNDSIFKAIKIKKYLKPIHWHILLNIAHF